MPIPLPEFLLYAISLSYAPVITRLVFYFANDNVPILRRLNGFAGRLELSLGWVRDYFMIPLSLYVLGLRIYGWIEVSGYAFPLEFFPFGLSLYARWWRWHGLAILHEFARLNPKVHPSEFMEHLYARLGFLPHPVPKRGTKFIDPNHLDFRKNKPPRKSFLILLHGLYDSFLFTTLAYKASRWGGADYIKTAGSGLSLIWATRLAQVARMEVIVEKSPEAKTVKGGKQIFAITHKSFSDFCLAPLVYFKENADGSAASFMPRIMVAKDHFKDNLFLHRIVGFGRMLESWGMVFVDRKSKALNKAKSAVNQTVQKILSSDMTFSIYPQGTRSWGQFERDGSRWDAGYFCVGKKARLKKEGGHFKMGVAYIAVETALGLLRHKFGNLVWIIPIGMDGPGTACPKGSSKIQTETKIVIKVGVPIVINTEEVKKLEGSQYQELVNNVARKIDKALQQLLETQARLERRFFTDLREIVNQRDMDEVAVALKEWRMEGEAVYAILDCIYALKQKHWRPFLTELANLLRHECSKEELLGLRTKIADCF